MYCRHFAGHDLADFGGSGTQIPVGMRRILCRLLGLFVSSYWILSRPEAGYHSWIDQLLVASLDPNSCSPRVEGTRSTWKAPPGNHRGLCGHPSLCRKCRSLLHLELPAITRDRRIPILVGAFGCFAMGTLFKPEPSMGHPPMRRGCTSIPTGNRNLLVSAHVDVSRRKPLDKTKPSGTDLSSSRSDFSCLYLLGDSSQEGEFRSGCSIRLFDPIVIYLDQRNLSRSSCPPSTLDSLYPCRVWRGHMQQGFQKELRNRPPCIR